MRPVVAIVVAAGRSRRMAAASGQPLNKLLLQARGRSVLAWTLSIFEHHPGIERVYVTASEDDIDTYHGIVAGEGLRKVAAIVRGGRERQESVYLALQHVRQNDPDAAADPLVAIHDGARPLLSSERLADLLAAAAAEAGPDSQGGALLSVPARETLKRVRDGMVVETVPREEMMMAQTPQVFPLHTVLAAHERAERDGFAATDDATLVERAGGRVRVVLGDYDNIKVTTPEDLLVLEGILEHREVDLGTHVHG